MGRSLPSAVAIFILLVPVYLYRRLISPWMLPCCRFTPSCSEYAETALKRHGALKGGFLALKRLLRCHPFCKAGHDPVPGKDNPS